MNTAFHLFSLIAFSGLLLYVLKLNRQIASFKMMLGSLQDHNKKNKTAKIRVDFPADAMRRVAEALEINLSGEEKLKNLPPMKINYGAFLSLASQAPLTEFLITFDTSNKMETNDASKNRNISITLTFDGCVPDECRNVLDRLINTDLPFRHESVNFKLAYKKESNQ